MYQALVIGCGNIGALYDIDSNQVLTHVKGYHQNPAFSLSIYDMNEELTKRLGELYNCVVLKDLNTTDLTSFDCLSICTPTPSHVEYLARAINAGTKVIICEKPVSNTLSNLDTALELYRGGNSAVIVNYFRRFQPAFIALQKKLSSILETECLTNICIRYQRGFCNNASHALDLLEFLCDRPFEISDVKTHNLKCDQLENDPTLSLQGFLSLNSKNSAQKIAPYVNINILGLTDVEYSHFELELYFKRSKVLIRDSGNTIEFLRAPSPGAFFRQLELIDSWQCCIENHMTNVISHVKTVLDKQLPRISQAFPPRAGQESAKYESAKFLSGEGVLKHIEVDKNEQTCSLPAIGSRIRNKLEQCGLDKQNTQAPATLDTSTDNFVQAVDLNRRILAYIGGSTS